MEQVMRLKGEYVIPHEAIPEVMTRISVSAEDRAVCLERTEPMFTTYWASAGEISPFFLKAMKEKKIIGARCPKCKMIICPPYMTRCPVCQKDDKSLVDLELGMEMPQVGYMLGTPPITVFANARFAQEKDGYSLQKDPSATDSNIDMKIPPVYKNAFASYDSKTNSLIVYLVSEDGKVVKVPDELAREWFESQATVRAVVSNPWVLVQSVTIVPLAIRMIFPARAGVLLGAANDWLEKHDRALTVAMLGLMGVIFIALGFEQLGMV